LGLGTGGYRRNVRCAAESSTGKASSPLENPEYRSDDTVRRVAGVQILTPVNAGRLSDLHGLVTVQMKEDSRGFTIVDIGTILGLAHLIPEQDRRWLVNSQRDLSTFNEVY